jgi:hypothetical protein
VPATPTYALPYPALADPANGPAAFQSLATTVEDVLETVASGAGITQPACRMMRAAAQSIPNAAWTTITWDTEVIDTGGMWVAGTPTKLIAAVAGIYQVSAMVSFDATTLGASRGVDVLRNDAYLGFQALYMTQGAGRRDAALTSGLVSLTPGQWLTVQVYQDSGSAVNTSTNSATQTAINAHRVSL